MLQQFGQVQQVRQVALAVLRQQTGGNAVLVDPAPEHGQHAVAQPGVMAGAALPHALLPGHVVLAQRVQLGPGQGQRRRGQGRAQQPLVLRRGAGGQPALQLARQGAVVDRAPVGQVDAAQAPLLQGMAYGIGFAPVVHQHGHVAGLHRSPGAVRPHEAGLPGATGVQQAHHLVGAHPGHVVAVGLRAQFLVLALLFARGPFLGLRAWRVPLHVPLHVLNAPEGQGGGHTTCAAFPALAATVSIHLLEGQQVLPSRQAVAEGAARGGLGLVEHAVDGPHHGLGGAVVGAQGSVPALGVVARGEVGVDVRAAKGVDRLLRVADQHQRGGRVVTLHAVDGVEDAVLQRVRVLELIDHRHRELRPDARRQCRAVGPAQRGVQAHQQVLEAHRRLARLLCGQVLCAPPGGVA